MKRAIPLSLIFLVLAAPAALAGGEIHGTITTLDGDTYTGPIRWDKNENFWDDVLDASKAETIKVKKREGLNVRVFGLEIVHADHHGNNWTRSQFTIPVGHLAAVESTDGREVRLELKSGDVLEIRESADFGSNMRGVVIETEDQGEVELEWSDVDRVEFSPGDSDRDAHRLYGTVETSIGEFTGFVVWDKDESLGEDILDGERDGRDRNVPMRNIASIEKLGSRKSRVTLKSGKVLDLSGTNDVDNDNRGIDINIADMGRVSVAWEEFQKVTFTDPPPSPRYDDFDGGRPLTGTVTTREGDSWTGLIVWDRDEVYTFEAIDGEIKNVQFEIQFEYIDKIDRASGSSATIRLKDGLEFTLRGSNDVGSDNKGIMVHTAEGEEIEIGWGAFESVVFSSE